MMKRTHVVRQSLAGVFWRNRIKTQIDLLAAPFTVRVLRPFCVHCPGIGDCGFTKSLYFARTFSTFGKAMCEMYGWFGFWQA